jgi:ABC-type Fe3+-hydroxamate transport system substrate-binding protein
MLSVQFFRDVLHFIVLIVIFMMGAFSCSSSDQQKTSGSILSLYPAITETIYHLEAQEQLGGRSDYCLFPEEVKSISSFGTSLTPNYEAIARERPRVILTAESKGTPVTQLQRIAPVNQLPWLTIEEVTESIVKLGVLISKEQEAKLLSEKIHSTLQSKARSDSPSLLILMQGSDIQKGQLWFMKHDSLHGTAIEAAGYHNAAPNETKGPPSMSIEQLLAQDPDIILFLTSSKISKEEEDSLVQSLSIIPSLKAVQKNKVGVVNGENLMGVGPGIILLVEKINEVGTRLWEAN